MANGYMTTDKTSAYLGQQITFTPVFFEFENKCIVTYTFQNLTTRMFDETDLDQQGHYVWTVPVGLVEFMTGASATMAVVTDFYRGSVKTGSHTMLLTINGYTSTGVTAPTAAISLADGSKTFTRSAVGAIDKFELQYTVGTYSATIAQNITASTYTWSLSSLSSSAKLQIASSAPNTSSVLCTISAIAYIGTTAVKTDTIKFKITIPDASPYKPTLSVSVSEANSFVSGKSIGAYLSGQSKLMVQASSATAGSGATIVQFKVRVENKDYTDTSSPYSITTDTISGSGSLGYTATLTDSRGRTATATGSVSVAAYNRPQITTQFTGQRTNSSGTYQQDGTYVKAAYAVSYTAAGSNTYSTTLAYSENGGAYNTMNAYSSSARTASVNGVLSGTGVPTFDPTKRYTLRLQLVDKLYTTTAYVNIPTQKVLLDFNENGTGLGIGMINQNASAIDSAWTYRGTAIRLTGSIYHNSDSEFNTTLLKSLDDTKFRGVIFNTTANRWQFREYTSGTSYWQDFYLPTPDATASGGAYAILTTKSTVTVAQGGTGADTAAGARTNLGLGSAATQNSSAFATAGHDHDSTYLKLSGGTLTGDLNGTSIKLSGGLREWTDSEIASVYVLNAAGSYSRGTVINSTANRWYFRSWSPNTSYWEQFQLPNPTATSGTTGTTYSILTTKAAVTVGQGGTGATSEAAARTNLGVNGKEWNASNLGSFNTTAASITLPQAGSWLIITGHNSTASLNSVFMVRTSGNRVWGIASAGTTSGGSTSYTWCGTVGLTASGTTITGITQGGGVNVYGVYLGTI